MSLPLDALGDLFGPGLIFLLLVGWLARKAWKAARTEGQLERERDAAGGMRPIDLPALPWPTRPVAQVPRESHASPDEPRAARGSPASGGPLPAGDPLHPFGDADVTQARPEHLAVLAKLLEDGPQRPAIEVVWVRSFGTHAAWLEVAQTGAQTLQVVKILVEAVVERWTFR